MVTVSQIREQLKMESTQKRIINNRIEYCESKIADLKQDVEFCMDSGFYDMAKSKISRIQLYTEKLNNLKL